MTERRLGPPDKTDRAQSQISFKTPGQNPDSGGLQLHTPGCYIITALHEMQTRSSDEKAVRLSVRPSVKRVNCDKTEERSVQIFTPYERSFSLVF